MQISECGMKDARKLVEDRHLSSLRWGGGRGWIIADCGLRIGCGAGRRCACPTISEGRHIGIDRPWLPRSLRGLCLTPS
jgi:hypothetical protein